MNMDVDHDLRGHFGDVRDQMERPTCLAFAFSDTHAACRPDWQPLSCEYLYYHAAQRGGGGPHDGATLLASLQALHEDGQPLEDGWRYITTPSIDPDWWAPPQDVGSVYKCNGSQHERAYGVVHDLVLDDHPAVVAMMLSDSFFMPVDGVIESPAPVPDSRRHAVIAVAAGRRHSTRFLLMRNSWGPSWGNGGYAWLSEDYLAPRLLAVAALRKVA